MDFKQLQSFVSVVKLKSFSKAADMMYLTQPTVSGHIQALENELGAILLNRNGNKNISATKAGGILFSYALDILNKRENVLFDLSKFQGSIAGILEISASTIPEQYVLPQLITNFNNLYPDVHFNLMRYDSQQVIDKILCGEIDFGIVGFKKELPQLTYMELMKDKIILIAPARKPYLSMENIDIQSLLELKILLREAGSGTRKSLENALGKHNFSVKDFNVIAYIENTETIKECVKNGLGLSFISEKAVEQEIEHNVLKILPVKNMEIERKFYFVYHKTRALSPLAETFKLFILNC